MDRWPDLLIDSMFEANAHTEVLAEYARRMVALHFACREVLLISVLARHSWAWESLGVNQWCEQRRSSS